MSAVARLAVYAGSFDPVTMGHVDLIDRASKLFSDVVVAIGVHATRQPLFSIDERMGLVQSVAKDYANVRVASFDGLLIDYCRNVGARGLRVRAADRARERGSVPRSRHDLPADAHQARLRVGVPRSRDRDAPRRREPLRAPRGLRRTTEEVRLVSISKESQFGVPRANRSLTYGHRVDGCLNDGGCKLLISPDDLHPTDGGKILSRTSLSQPYAVSPIIPPTSAFRVEPIATCGFLFGTREPGGCAGEQTCLWAKH